MNKKEQREAIEFYKMLKKFKATGDGYTIEESDTYDSNKKIYFEDILGIPNTVEIELEIDEERLTSLYQIADEEDKLIDEVVNEVLTKALSYIKEEEKLSKTETQEEYYNLVIGDIIQEGDEYFDCEKWHKTKNDGLRLDEWFCLKYRRKIVQPIQYRLLNDGEIIQAGDQFYAALNAVEGHNRNDWRDISTLAYKMEGLPFNSKDKYPYRRKI